MVLNNISIQYFREKIFDNLLCNELKNYDSNYFIQKINEFKMKVKQYVKNLLIKNNNEALSSLRNGISFNLNRAYVNKENVVVNITYDDDDKKTILITDTYAKYNDDLIEFESEIIKRKNDIEHYEWKLFSLLFTYEQIILETNEAPKTIDDFYNSVNSISTHFITNNMNKFTNNINKFVFNGISEFSKYKLGVTKQRDTILIDDTIIRNDITRWNTSLFNVKRKIDPFLESVINTTSIKIVSKNIKIYR